MNATVVERDGAILGQSTLGNPTSYFKATLQRDVERRHDQHPSDRPRQFS